MKNLNLIEAVVVGASTAVHVVSMTVVAVIIICINRPWLVR